MKQHFVRLGGVIAVLILMTAVLRFPHPQAAAQQYRTDVDVRDDASVFARIDSGGYEGQHLTHGYFWSADQAFSGGKITSNPAASIVGTDDDDLYRRARVATADLGGFGYAIPLPLNAAYSVRLHFAETYWGAVNGGPGGVGRRVFSANFEGGAAELDNFDINAEVGPQTAVVKEFSVPVSDGVLNIDFSASVNRPIVSAIEVLLYAAPAPYRPGITSALWINADTDQPLDIPEHIDEDEGLKPINLATLPTRNLNILAQAPAGIGSVKFIYAGQVRIENTAPYAAFGNQGADYLPWTPTPGEHELTVIAYTQPNAQGVAGPTVRAVLQVSDQAATPTFVPGTTTSVPATPTFVPGTATPSFVPGTATPSFVPGTATPSFVPGTATPSFVPGTAMPSPFPGTATPSFVPGTATPGVGPPPYLPLLQLDVTEQLQWYRPGMPNVGDFDVIIVQDTSQSMGYCWQSNQKCPVGQRRIDYGTSVVRQLLNEMLVVQPSQGFTYRAAYITYGPEQNGSSVKMRVPFSTSPAAYEPFVGSLSSPRNIPDAEISGYTNTAAALSMAQQYLNGARRYDQNGMPVRHAIILISDGTADVLFDAPYAGAPNRYDAAPFFCGDSADDLNNPLVQAHCPRGPQFGEPRAPIQAAIDVAMDIQTTTATRILSIVTGSPNGYTPTHLGINQISPYGYYMANDPAQLQGMWNENFVVELGEPCQEMTGEVRLAAGAQVTIKTQTGQLANQGVLNIDGRYRTQLAPGTYTVSVAHNGVIAPQDPLHIPRNYTRLVPSDSAVPVSTITFVVDYGLSRQINTHLVIDNPNNAKCQ